MSIGIIGLGKMGLNLALNLLDSQYTVLGYDIEEETRVKANNNGIQIFNHLESVIQGLDKPRKVWLMVPAGEITENVISEISPMLENDDIIIDGGNSFFKDSIRRSRELEQKGIHFFDAGTSGG